MIGDIISFVVVFAILVFGTRWIIKQELRLIREREEITALVRKERKESIRAEAEEVIPSSNPENYFIENFCKAHPGGTLKLFSWSAFGETPAARAYKLLLFSNYKMNVVLVEDGGKVVPLYSPNEKDTPHNYELVHHQLEGAEL